jgi:hypothetical protein
VTNRKLLSEAKLWLVAIPVLLWTLIPIYHIFLFSISTKELAFSGGSGPSHPDAAQLRHRVPAGAFLPAPLLEPDLELAVDRGRDRRDHAQPWPRARHSRSAG